MIGLLKNKEKVKFIITSSILLPRKLGSYESSHLDDATEQIIGMDTQQYDFDYLILF